MTPSTVLLTGSQGFTGRYMAAVLAAAGHQVLGWGTPGDGVAVEAVDLCNRDAVVAAVERASPEYVVHLAAISFVAHGDPAAIYNVNVVGTRNLLGALAGLKRPPRRVLLASSANVYGVTPGAIDESASFHPQNDYAVSKVAMEYMARLWNDRLPIVTARPFNYTGVGQDENFLLPKIVGHFRRKASVLELGNLDVCRDFYDVREVVRIYLGLLELAHPGEIYNVCSGQETSIRQIIGMMEQISGQSMDVRVNPAFVRANEVTHLRGDRGALESLLGPQPQYALADTLRWMYANAT